MTLLNTGNLPSFPTANGNLPSENSRSVPLSFSWANNQVSYSGDLFDVIENGQLSLVQSIFIDNSAVYGPVTLTWLGTGQKIVLPAGWQGYFPVFVAGGNSQFTLSGGDAPPPIGGIAGNNTTLVWVNNFPMPASAWKAQQLTTEAAIINNQVVAAGGSYTSFSAVTKLWWTDLTLWATVAGLASAPTASYLQLRNGTNVFAAYALQGSGDGGQEGLFFNVGAQTPGVPIPPGLPNFNVVFHNGEANSLTVNAYLFARVN